MKNSRLTRVTTAFSAAIVLLLSGCAAIPNSSGVQLGSDITKNVATDFLYFSPYAPPVGASISELLAGFLSAGTGPQNDYLVAREYLASNLKTTWLPSQEVVVADTNPEISVEGTSAVVTVQSTAVIDAGGRMSLLLSGNNREYSFGFVKEGGQWRINKAPNLTIVSRPVFDVVFKSYALYFLDSQKHYLVPDTRWFPSRASTATRLVNGLIAGPAPWLGDSLYNPIPAGTKLAVDAVTVSNGVASIDFNGKFLSASGAVRGQIKAQIDATLGQIAGVRTTQISADRNVQDIPKFEPKVLPAVTLSPVVLTKDSLAYASANTLNEIDSTRAAVSNLKPNDFALTSDNNLAAFTGSSGLHLVTLENFGSETVLLDPNPNLLSPTFDRQGWLWSVGSTVSPQIKVFSKTGTEHSLQSLAFAGRKILSYSVSPEGARFAAVVEAKGKNEIWLFGITRTKTGLPSSLSESVAIPSVILNATTVSWLDGSKLGLLSQSNAGWSQPTEINIGGFEQPITGLQGLQQFIGNNPSGARFALNDKGVLFQYRNSAWVAVQSEIKKVHYSQ